MNKKSTPGIVRGHFNLSGPKVKPTIGTWQPKEFPLFPFPLFLFLLFFCSVLCLCVPQLSDESWSWMETQKGNGTRKGRRQARGQAGRWHLASSDKKKGTEHIQEKMPPQNWAELSWAALRWLNNVLNVLLCFLRQRNVSYKDFLQPLRMP